jgi:hypothetical protein
VNRLQKSTPCHRRRPAIRRSKRDTLAELAFYADRAWYQVNRLVHAVLNASLPFSTRCGG